MFGCARVVSGYVPTPASASCCALRLCINVFTRMGGTTRTGRWGILPLFPHGLCASVRLSYLFIKSFNYTYILIHLFIYYLRQLFHEQRWNRDHVGGGQRLRERRHHRRLRRPPPRCGFGHVARQWRASGEYARPGLPGGTHPHPNFDARARTSQ